ncbi:alpha-galactosidase [Streptomyces sp. SCSIO ZS0520]|uniref:alpha-galactosidase n=1 Tax=Streptomyces sp. SCSIO ZS0520 TaxID=2892996 RepID=UPI0021D9D496|nr:alpha-galactosidase [Streptomyces sp. SCSIO ZS0520]
MPDPKSAPVPASRLHLRAAGCSLLLELTPRRLPLVRHWGADLGPLDETAAAGASRAAARVGRRPGELDAELTSVVPEPWTGWTGRPGLLASRRGRDWSPAFTLTRVTFDGAPVPGWAERGAGLVEATAVDPESRLRLVTGIELLDSGLVRLRAELTNEGEELELSELSVHLPVPAHATELLDFSGRWGMERLAQRRAFGVGTHLRENRRGRTGFDAAHVLHATERGSGFGHGESWAVHVAWSGNHRHLAEHDSTGVRLLGGGELLLPGEVRLATGESYRTPWVYGAYGEGLDRVAHRFHDHLRGRAHHARRPRPVTLNVWEAVYFAHEPDRLIRLAELAAEAGVERFVLDDGWFGARRDARAGLGDWQVSPEVWPEGLHPLVDAVRGLGMEFGLWVEPEMVNPDSDLARAHPEWIMAARGEPPLEQRHQQVLNLSLPACYEAVLGQLLAILDTYPIGSLKWDHNRDHVEAGSRPEGGVPAEHAQTLALYRMLREIKEAHPGLEIESCSGGGGRVDLGILELTDRVWVSDCIDAVEQQRLLRWTGQLLPPELMGSHISSPRSHTTGRRLDLSFRGATALFGHLGVEWDLAAASEEERRELAGWIALHKEHRRLLHTGRVWRGPDPDDSLQTHGVIAEDGSEALYALVSLTWCAPAAPPHARLTGLDPRRRYRVRPLLTGGPPPGFAPPEWWDEEGVEITGAVLARVGLQVPVMHPEHSVLVHVSAVDRAAR